MKYHKYIAAGITLALILSGPLAYADSTTTDQTATSSPPSDLSVASSTTMLSTTSSMTSEPSTSTSTSTSTTASSTATSTTSTASTSPETSSTTPLISTPALTITPAITSTSSSATSTAASTTQSNPNLVLIGSNVSNPDLQQGQSAIITSQIRSVGTTTSNVIVELTIFDESNKIRIPTTYPNQTLQAETNTTFTAVTPTTLAPSHYHVWISVYSADHSTTLATFTNAGTFVVEPGQTSGNSGGTETTTTGTSTSPTTGTTTPSTLGFTLRAVNVPSTFQVGTPAIISANVTNTGQSLNPGIADIEIYDSSNNKIFQNFFTDQNFSSNTTQNYSVTWTPQMAGNFTLKFGVFTNNWSQTVAWNDTAAQLVVSNATSTDMTSTSTSTSTSQMSTSTNSTNM